MALAAVQGALLHLEAASNSYQQTFSSSHNVIPFMEWEIKLQSTLAISKDQMRFMLAMFGSVILGAGLRLFRNSTLRHFYALATGLILTYYPFGAGVFHALPVTVLTYLAMWLAPKQAGMLSWWINFPYLIYLHVVNASGMSWSTGQMDFTAGQMVLMLKLISVAVSYSDNKRKKKEDLTPFQATHAVASMPSPLEFLSYVFSLGNLLAGPYFEFKKYKEFMDLKGVWNPKASQPVPSVVLPFLACIGQVVLFMGFYLKFVGVYNVLVYDQPWFASGPLYMRCFVIVITGIVNQCKYCFSWKLSEASMILAGFNFLEWDAKTGKAVWGRCCNVRFFGLLACDSATLVPTVWNICTGHFLRRYVYERVTRVGQKPGFMELFVTQMTSAVWHGLYAGYLLFFAGTAIWIQFSKLLYKAEIKFMPAVSKSLPWHVMKSVWTNFVLNYMASSFMVLELKASLSVYRAIYYAPHVIMFIGIFIGPSLLSLGGTKKSKFTPKKEQKEL